jgi:hypothetical protein
VLQPEAVDTCEHRTREGGTPCVMCSRAANLWSRF